MNWIIDYFRRDTVLTSPKSMLELTAPLGLFSISAFGTGVPEWILMMIYTLMWIYTGLIALAGILSMIQVSTLTNLLAKFEGGVAPDTNELETLTGTLKQTYFVSYLFQITVMSLMFYQGFYIMGSIFMLSLFILVSMLGALRGLIREVILAKLSAE